MVAIQPVYGMTSIDKIVIDAADTSHRLQVSTAMNSSEYFLHIEGEVLEFSITVVSWGNSSPGPYNGLMVELVIDSTDLVHNSWLISHGDSSTHFFTSVTEISEIVRIRLSALYIEECIFDLTTSIDYPIWTYNLNVLLEKQFMICVERAEDYYLILKKLVITLDSKYLESDNYSFQIYDYSLQLIGSGTDNFALSDKSELDITIEEGIFEGEWYEVGFNFEGYDPSSEIILRMYYDHFQTENIIRMFLNTGSNDIYQVPIDMEHSGYAFRWTIYYDYTYIPPPFDFTFIFYIALGLFSLIGTLIVISVLSNRRNRQTFDQVLNRNKVEYSPNNAYPINFNKTTMNYNLVTKEAVTVSCSICMQTITDKESIIRCPSCDIAFHKNHLYQWVVGNGTCPACKVRLKIQQH
jgi:hypothetical protein